MCQVGISRGQTDRYTDATTGSFTINTRDLAFVIEHDYLRRGRPNWENVFRGTGHVKWNRRRGENRVDFSSPTFGEGITRLTESELMAKAAGAVPRKARGKKRMRSRDTEGDNSAQGQQVQGTMQITKKFKQGSGQQRVVAFIENHIKMIFIENHIKGIIIKKYY